MFNLTWLKNFLLIQLLAALGISCGFWIGKGSEAGLSALMGGFIGIVPGLLFMRLLFKQSGTKLAKQILSYFYLGEILKILISLILFTLAFQWGKLRPAPLFLVFIATYGVCWLIPWLANEKPKKFNT